MGILDLIREPRAEGVAPGWRGAAPVVSGLLFEAEGASRTRRRNCVLFILKEEQ